MDAGARLRDAGSGKEEAVPEKRVTLEMSKADAEVLLGILVAERHNPDVEAVCDALRAQLDEKIAESSA